MLGICSLESFGVEGPHNTSIKTALQGASLESNQRVIGSLCNVLSWGRALAN